MLIFELYSIFPLYLNFWSFLFSVFILKMGGFQNSDYSHSVVLMVVILAVLLIVWSGNVESRKQPSGQVFCTL